MNWQKLMRKWAGVVGIGIFVVVAGLIVAAGYRSVSFTISNSTSQSLAATISFCVFGCIASLLVGYSLLFYLPGKWGLGWGYRILAGLIGLAFFVTCLVPNDPNSYNLHDYGSWAMATFSFALVTFLYFRLWSRYRTKLRVVNAVVFAIMATVAAMIFTQYRFFRSFVLIFESSFVLSFFTLVLFLIFDKPRRK